MIRKSSIAKLFATDTLICAINHIGLMDYQMQKHGWTFEQWNEYFTIYRTNINNLCVINQPRRKAE